MKKILIAVIICWFVMCGVSFAEDVATPSDFDWGLSGGLGLTYITPWLPLPEDITPGIYPSTKLTLIDYKQGLITGGFQAVWTKALKDGRVLPDVWGAGINVNLNKVISQIPNASWVGDIAVTIGCGLLFKEDELDKPMANLSLSIVRMF